MAFCQSASDMSHALIACVVKSVSIPLSDDVGPNACSWYTGTLLCSRNLFRSNWARTNYYSPHGMDQYSRDNPEYSRDSEEDRVEHRMEEPNDRRVSYSLFQILQEQIQCSLFCPIKSYVYRAQRNRPCRRENQERKPRPLRLRMPGMCFLQILEGINAKEQLGNRQEQHNSKEYSEYYVLVDVP
jgi:hypothetical protein